jgi:anaerobic selenocysteine-containing dehydrogenase
MTIDELRSHPAGITYPMKPMVYEKYEKFFSTRSSRLSGEPYLPEGKVAIYNTTFEKHGLNPLPEWRELPEGVTATPELLKDYPLILSDFHTSKAYNASWLRNVPYLREVLPYPTLQIHPDTASERGIGEGDWVIVESPHGTMKLKAEIIPGIRPDTVMTLHGWWQGCGRLGLPGYPLLDGGANSNNMYSVDLKKALDPLVTAMSSQTLVQVRKA